MYLLKLAVRPWKLAMWSQSMSSISVAFLLFSITLLFWLEQGLGPVIARLQGDQVLTAYIVPTLPAPQEKELVDAIRVSVGASAERAKEISVRLTTAKDFLNILNAAHPSLSEQLVELSESEPQVSELLIPRFVTVSGLLKSDAATEIKALPGVESVESSEGRTRPIASAFIALRWVARWLALGLFVALLNSLIHLGRSHAAFHGQSLAILRLWGADSIQSQLPCALSGFSIGVLGGVLACVTWFVLQSVLRSRILLLSPAFESLPENGQWFAAFPLMIGAVFGLACGFLGSLPTRRRG